MTHTYNVSGMTCSSCQAKVQTVLSKVDHVKHVNIDLKKGEASIEMNKHIATGVLKDALKDFPKYQLSEKINQPLISIPVFEEEDKRTWLEIYKPLLLIFGYITGITLLATWLQHGFSWMGWMNYFMAGFFIVFSFFKLLNLRGFAESYAMYDIIAKSWQGWGYIYAFTELALGIALLVGFNPLLTYTVTVIIMTVSIIGVLQSVLNKRKIKCACLGDVFNLPMSTVTIVEDSLMIVMSGFMIISLLK